jgi:hypothetical protein
MQQRLKQLLRLTFCFALLRPQPIKLLDDAREFFLHRDADAVQVSGESL